MKIKILALSVLLIPRLAFSVTPGRLIEGKFESAKAKMNGTLVYTQKEIDDYALISTGTASVTLFSKTALEQSISDSGLKFDNKSDFEACVKSTDVIQDKFDSLKTSEKKQLQAIISAITSGQVK